LGEMIYGVCDALAGADASRPIDQDPWHGGGHQVIGSLSTPWTSDP
jgi:hypothetical protein